MGVELVAVEDAATRDAARRLIAEYLQWIAGNASANYGLAFDIGAMVASDLDDRAKFFPPGGRFYVVRNGDDFVGVGCLKALAPGIAELQRMYVQPHVRGIGAGRLLQQRLLADAREIGYRAVRLESLKFLSAAHALYKSAGFIEIAPYADNSMQAFQPQDTMGTYRSSAVFMELRLARAPEISLVIPAWNEEALLPALLDSVRVAAAQYDGAVEVIVANNASTDRTADIAITKGAIVADVPKRGIACARNGGAKIATGEILCFLDGDSIMHPRAFVVIAQAFANPRVGGGATGAVVERWTWPLRLLFMLVIPLTWFGLDTGVVFCRRADFEAIGGYNEALLVAEDVDFLLRIRRQVKAGGRRMLRVRGVEAITSARKFDKYGHWHFMGSMARLPWLLLFNRKGFEKVAKKYWYEGR